MNSSTNQLIKTTLISLSTGVAASLVSGAALAQNLNHWQSLALGSCKVQPSQQQAFLYCKGAPSRVATAVLDTKALSPKQVRNMQCHTSLNGRQINCFAPQTGQVMTAKHVALLDVLQQCKNLNWQKDVYGDYQLRAKSCQLSVNDINSYSQVTTYISLADFKAYSRMLDNPVIVSYNGELTIDNADDSAITGCVNGRDTSMGDDTGKTSMGDDTGKTSMGDDTGKTSMGDDTGKTSMGDDTGKTSIGDDTGKTSMGDDTGKSCMSDTSMGDDTGKTSMGDDTGKTSMGDDTGKTSMGDDTGKTSMGDDTGKTSMGDDTGKTSMGDDTDFFTSDTDNNGG